MRNTRLALAALSFCVGTSLAQENYGQWKYTRSVTLNTTATGAGVTANVTKFPLLVRLGASDTAIFSASQSSGADIRFSKPDGTPMKHQVERWDAVNKLAEVWVLVDTVYGNDSTHSFKMYFGNNAAADSSSGAAVFETNNGFAGTWHFNGGNFIDATLNHNNGTDHDSKDTIGIIGGARAFHGTTGTPQYVSVPDAPSLNVTSAITLSAWVKPSAWATNNRVMQKNGTANGDDQYRLYASSATALRLTLAGTSGTTPTVTAPAAGGWHLVHAVYDGSNVRLYVDGTQGSTAAVTGAMNVAGGELWFGAKPLAAVTADYSNIAMDEPRVSSVARSADWIKLDFQTQKAAAGLTFGPISLQPPTGIVYAQNPVIYTVGYSAGSNLATTLGGAATKFSVTPALPAGLALDTNTGIVSGTPTTAAAAANYTVTATNGAGSTTVALNITVNATLVAPTSFSYKTNPVVYFSGTAITPNNPVVLGTVTSYSVTPALPAGLTLNTTTGVISGTPTAGTAAANYTVTASNSAGSITVSLNVAVTAAPANLNYPTSNATYFVGQPITPNVPTFTGTATSFTSVPLLSTIGLTLNQTTGVISGTPTAFAWTADYIITASNPAGSTKDTIAITVYVPVEGILSKEAQAFAIRVSGSKSVSFRLPEGAESGRLSIVDLSGHTLWSRTLSKSSRELSWNGESGKLSAGIYMARMTLWDSHQRSMGTVEKRITLTP